MTRRLASFARTHPYATWHMLSMAGLIGLLVLFSALRSSERAIDALIMGYCVLLTVPYLFFDLQDARSRRLRARGLCPRCGYDLRATPDRCPECGLAATREIKP